MARAYNTNSELLAARAQLRAADEGIPQALAHIRPSASIDASYSGAAKETAGGSQLQNQYYSTDTRGSNYSLSITQPLFRGGRTLAETKQANAAVGVARAQLAQTEQSVLLRAITAYLDVVHDEAGLELARVNERMYLERKGAAAARSGAGAASRIDLEQTEAAYQQARVQSYEAELKLQTSRENFQREVGLPPAGLALPKPPPMLPASEAEARNLAGIHNPQVLHAQYVQDVARQNIGVLQSQALPQISAYVTADHQEGVLFPNQSQNSVQGGIRLSMQLYTGGALESQVRASRQTLQARASQSQDARLQAASEASIAWRKLQTTRLTRAALEAKDRAEAVALQGVQRQQELGERIMLDVINAQFALFATRQQAITAQHDEMVAQYTLLSAIGQLNAKRLALPVVPYDVNSHLESVRNRWFGFGD